MKTMLTITLAVVGLAIVVTAFGLWKLGTMTTQGCRQILSGVTGESSMSRSKQFSTDYGIARNRFLDAAQSAGALIESLKNPHTSPKDEPLYLDVAMLGARNPRRIPIVGSYTHGVEGFAGSGIQSMLLEDGIEKRLPPYLSLLMIHGINPYGMAYLRRVNEDNVDLNRNWFIPRSLLRAVSCDSSSPGARSVCLP